MTRRLSVLIYHRVLPEPDLLQPDIPTADLFARHLRWLARVFRVLPLEDAVRRLREGTLPRRAVAITFDDGYADNAEVALPILQQLGLSATFFIATGFLNDGRMWNDTVIEALRRWPEPTITPPGGEPLPCTGLDQRKAALPPLLEAIKYLPPQERITECERLAQRCGAPLPGLMMSEEQLRSLARAGMGIGGHTVSHPILARLDEARARDEIAQGKKTLEKVVEAPVALFAYPNGKPGRDYTARDVAIVRDVGFEAAVSTTWGVAGEQSDVYQLPRFTPWDRHSGRFIGRLLAQRWAAAP